MENEPNRKKNGTTLKERTVLTRYSYSTMSSRNARKPTGNKIIIIRFGKNNKNRPRFDTTVAKTRIAHESEILRNRIELNDQ